MSHNTNDEVAELIQEPADTDDSKVTTKKDTPKESHKDSGTDEDEFSGLNWETNTEEDPDSDW